MAKLFVSIVNNHRKHRICKDDIRNVHSVKPRRLPAIPSFYAMDPKRQEDDRLTSCGSSEAEFEPMEFFPPSQGMQNE